MGNYKKNQFKNFSYAIFFTKKYEKTWKKKKKNHLTVAEAYSEDLLNNINNQIYLSLVILFYGRWHCKKNVLKLSNSFLTQV